MKIKRIISQKIPTVLFVYLKNIQSRIQQRRVKYSVSDSLIEIKYTKEYWTTHRHRLHLYTNGLRNRGNSIGKSYLLENIEFNNGDVIIDCGANMGDLQLYFISLGIKVQYFGIEPNPIDFRCLESNLNPGHFAWNLALWNETKTLKFYVDSKSASSSLIEPPYFTDILSIKAVRLDEIELPPRIKLLKIEGEGAEPEILEGCRDVLNRVEYISVDAGPERGIAQTSPKNDVIAYLVENNFEVILENPYHRVTVLFKNKSL